MRKSRATLVRDVEPTRELVKTQGGHLGSLWRVGASLKNGVVTKHARRLARFCLVGISGVGVNSALLYLLTEAGGLNPLVAAVFATEAAIFNNFVLNDLWTFGDVKAATSWPWRALRYNSVALVGLIISVAVLAGLTYLLSMHYLVANLFAIGAGTMWNYTGSSHFTWAAFKVGIPSVGALAALLGWGRSFVSLIAKGGSKP